MWTFCPRLSPYISPPLALRIRRATPSRHWPRPRAHRTGTTSTAQRSVRYLTCCSSPSCSSSLLLQRQLLHSLAYNLDLLNRNIARVRAQQPRCSAARQGPSSLASSTAAHPCPSTLRAQPRMNRFFLARWSALPMPSSLKNGLRLSKSSPAWPTTTITSPSARQPPRQPRARDSLRPTIRSARTFTRDSSQLGPPGRHRCYHPAARP